MPACLPAEKVCILVTEVGVVVALPSWHLDLRHANSSLDERSVRALDVLCPWTLRSDGRCEGLFTRPRAAIQVLA